MPDRPTVIFVHVPKTGGITLGCSLRWQYGSRHTFTTKWNAPAAANPFEALSEASRRRIRVVKGHVLYGVDRFLPQPCTYVTMLRDPVPRVLSLYYFVQANWPESEAGQASLRAFVAESILPYRPNDQTRRLSGRATDAQGRLPDDALDVARANLDADFAAVGTTERFDETMVLWQRRLGWRRPPFYVRSNTNRSRPTRDAIDDDVLALIRADNAMDVALYDALTDRLDAMIAEEGPGFADAVDRFQTMNAACQTLAGGPLQLFRRTRAFAQQLWS